MPYPRTLQAYCPPEFFVEPPASWVRRLAEIAPERGDMDHLVFRCFEPKEPDGSDKGWNHKDRPIWALYAAKPIRLVEKDRASQFEKHWSELPDIQQEGRKAVVSDYQHFMWHSRGLYVKPFLILQGEWGGTPTAYTETEKAFLRASDCFDEPLPIGMFPACPFDERVVAQIARRDRMLQCANRYEDLVKKDSSESQKAETESAERLFRETYIDTWKIMIQPSADFYSHWMRRSENRESLPAAPDPVKQNIGRWKDHWLEHGVILGAGPAKQTQIH
jgi:hypothetical protein